jgi:hypothetical protein
MILRIQHLYWLFLLLGVIGLAIQTFVRINQENALLEAELHRQHEALISGLKTKWREFLLEKAKRRELPETYRVEWNRLGTQMKDPNAFFPDRPSILDWEQYRRIVARSQNHEAEVREFLQNALKRRHSWDRVLAISEWKNQFGEFPLIVPHTYEETLISEEARGAYEQIFAQFSVTMGPSPRQSMPEVVAKWCLEVTVCLPKEVGSTS